MKKFLLSAAICSTFLFPNNVPVPSDGSDLKITIYNSNIAFINDFRQSNVEKGIQKLVYEGVPSSVITESVIPTFTGIKTNLYSQNYMYDLISLNSMIKKSIDTEIEFYDNHSFDNPNPELHKGILLSMSPIMIKRNSDNKIITLNSGQQIVFSKIPESMITKPSLVWNVKTKKSGLLNIDLKYLTRGITWNSNYVLDLSKDNLNLNGWITIKNNSGVSYNNAEITCLAGEVNRINKNRSFARDKMLMKSVALVDEEMSVKEESFSGYHIYKIPFKEDIKNKQSKQISFINKSNIKYLQYGQATNNYFNNYGKQSLVFKNIIEFKNSENNNLGIPLPEGSIRMYNKDSKGKTHFIGEQRIKNIPKDENIKLTIGNMFDVVGDKKITKFKADKYHRNVETTYEVRNRGIDNVIIKISERIPVFGRKIKVSTNCKNNCSFEKKSAFIREYRIKLDAGEVYKFSSEFDVQYH